jgi:hypothetical protein
MIKDLENPLVVSQGGVLETIFTDGDWELIETQKKHALSAIHSILSNTFNESNLQSQKMAILDLMREFDHPEVVKHITQFQNEL